MKYEYKIEQFKERGFGKGEIKWQELEERLNALGAEGWSVQGVQSLQAGLDQQGVVVFLKREPA